ncbi:hypothetical protein CBR_g23008 [Chara braunii]|uniref:Autophagy-related protein 101 n=1 Tax=Chara braunii TaxID=69332 RepID=A0A388L3L2_CHABU|nr:hypothetical protein CBR_g23008 [Chara braunii]|eukprot:GBG76793.1 hypothetical protein CBR_g23008 [Chara braunii]
MNCEVFDLKELEVEYYQVREVLRCILHTIMFNRALGLIRPKEVESMLFDITYVQTGDPGIEKKIEEKIDQFCTWVDKHPNKKGQVCLSFFEERKISWFTRPDRLYWERWFVRLNVVRATSSAGGSFGNDSATYLDSAEEPNRKHATLEVAVRDTIMRILQLVNEKRDHIPPPVESTDAVTFPYEISFPSSSDSSFGMDILKRIMQTNPPAMLS